MRAARIVTAVAAGLVIGFLWTRTAVCDDAKPDRPRPKEARDREDPNPPPREGDAERGRRPPPKPGERDFDRPPPKEGDFDRPGPKPEEGDFPRHRRPMRPGDGDFGPGARGPMREGPMDRPPMEGGPARRGPLGEAGPPEGAPGRWPHENMQWMERSDPEMFKLLKEDMDLDRQSRELSMQYRRAPAEQRDEIKKKVVEAVGRHFEARQKRRQLELKRLETEIQSVRESIERREKARGEITERRVLELLGREDDMRF